MSLQQRGKLRSSKLPDRLMCCGCQKSKTLSYFPQRQLDTARHVTSRGSRPTSAKCIACFEISTHKLEMQCKQCDKVLSLDDFSRSQRKDPDNAKCKDCMEVHLLQDAPTTVYDAYKARFEGVVEEQDYIDADDYSDMQTNQWESTVDSDSESGVALPNNNRGQSVTSRCSTIASEFLSMFSQTQSSTSTKASDDDEEEDDDLGEEEPATTSIYRRTVSHRVAQSYDSDEDEEDDDDISSDSTERPVKPSPISLTGRSDFCPVDPISHPNQYRERGDATSSNHVLANPSSSAQQENTHQQTPHKGHWAKNPRASKPPPQTSFQADYDVQSTYSEDRAKQRYPEGDDDSDPENWA